MSIWMEKDGVLSSMTPTTDILAPVAALLIGWGAAKGLQFFQIAGTIAVAVPWVLGAIVGVGGTLIGRINFVEAMKKEVWK